MSSSYRVVPPFEETAESELDGGDVEPRKRSWIPLLGMINDKYISGYRGTPSSSGHTCTTCNCHAQPDPLATRRLLKILKTLLIVVSFVSFSYVWIRVMMNLMNWTSSAFPNSLAMDGSDSALEKNLFGWLTLGILSITIFTLHLAWFALGSGGVFYALFLLDI